MKYKTEVIVEVPLYEFVKKLDSTDNLKHWQRGLISTEHISGEPGTYGAKMKMTYKMGKRNMELIETIERNELPNEFVARYSSKGMYNLQHNYFSRTANGHTSWVSENEFVPLNLPMRLFILLMPSTFKKQSKLYMNDFKNFAEKGTSIAND